MKIITNNANNLASKTIKSFKSLKSFLFLTIFLILINSIFPTKLKLNSLNNIKIKSSLENNLKESESESESEELNIAGKLKGKIYLNIKGNLNLEKHKKSQMALNSKSSTKKKEELKGKKSPDFHNEANSGNNKTFKFNSPIFLENWVKYFKYTDKELNVKTPKKFLVNSGYYQQTRLYPNTDFKKNKEFIRDKNFFYLSVFKDALVFSTSKKV